MIARDQANQALVKHVLEIHPDRAIREFGDEDIAQWIVVRVNDDITVALLTEVCGVRFEDACDGIKIETIDGVPIPFAGAALMLKMKQGVREKDTADRSFLQQLLRAKNRQRRKPYHRPHSPRRQSFQSPNNQHLIA
jgi:hypothetical protein